jgi:NADH/NAD ratio-sensing transcriptional regulator Rex
MDVSGYGELKDFPAKESNIKFDNTEYRNSLFAYFSGSTVMGYKMADIITATLYLKDYKYADKNNISIIGIGKLGPVVLHAAAIGDYYSDVKTINSIESWEGIIKNPVQANLFGIVVPNALKYYDLSDLNKIICK